MIAALFALALLPRLLYLSSIPSGAILEAVDARGYDLLARNLLAGHGFSLRDGPPYAPDGLRTPLYPLFLSGVYALPIIGGPLLAALLQALLDSLTTLLAGDLARRLWGWRAGMLTAALYALTPLQWRYAAALLTEAPLAFLITLALWTFARHLISFFPAGKKGRARWALSSGALAGLAACCKPNVEALALILALALWVARRPKRQIFLFLGSALLVISPWLARNWILFGRPFLSQAGLGFVARVSAPATLGVVRGHQAPPWTPEWEARYAEVVAQARARHNWSDVALLSPREADRRERHMAQAAWEVLRAHPRAALQAHLVGFVRSWAPREQSFWYAHLSRRPWEALGLPSQTYRDALEIMCDGRPLEALAHAFVEPWGKLDPLGRLLWYGWGIGQVLGVILTLVGLWHLRQRPALALAFGLTLLYVTLLPGPIGYERFRVPVMPLITVLEVGGAMSLGHDIQRVTAQAPSGLTNPEAV